MQVQMKPETIKRRAIKRRLEIAERRAQHIERLKVIVATNDPTGVYAELLGEAEARQRNTVARL